MFHKKRKKNREREEGRPRGWSPEPLYTTPPGPHYTGGHIPILYYTTYYIYQAPPVPTPGPHGPLYYNQAPQCRERRGLYFIAERPPERQRSGRAPRAQPWAGLGEPYYQHGLLLYLQQQACAGRAQPACEARAQPSSAAALREAQSAQAIAKDLLLLW